MYTILRKDRSTVFAKTKIRLNCGRGHDLRDPPPKPPTSRARASIASTLEGDDPGPRPHPPRPLYGVLAESSVVAVAARISRGSGGAQIMIAVDGGCRSVGHAAGSSRADGNMRTRHYGGPMIMTNAMMMPTVMTMTMMIAIASA